MADHSSEELFDATLRILLLERSIVVTFDNGSNLRIRFPTTRRIAEFLATPHYLVLRSCAQMEVEGMVTKAERAGIVTTHKGSRKMIELMQDRYRLESEAVLGTAILDELGKITA